MTLSESLKAKIQAEFTKTPYKVFWDRNDSFSDKQLVHLLKGEISEIENEIENDNNFFLDERDEHAKEIIEKFDAEIGAENNLDVGDFDFDQFWHTNDFDDDFEFYTELNLKQLARISSDIRVRIKMNVECEGAYDMGNSIQYNDNFKELVDFLKLNPKEVKSFFLSKGWETIGRFPNKPNRKPLVGVEDFFVEVENNSYTGNLFFYGRIDCQDLFNLEGKPKKAIVKKGEDCGFVNCYNGSGSVLGMKMLQDITIDLEKHPLIYDKDSSQGYGIDETFGLSNEGWGKENIGIY